MTKAWGEGPAKVAELESGVPPELLGFLGGGASSGQVDSVVIASSSGVTVSPDG